MPRGKKSPITPFPLFKLPFVALKEIVKHWTPVEIIELSMVSTKTTNWLEVFQPAVTVKIDVDIANDYEPSVSVFDDQEDIRPSLQFMFIQYPPTQPNTVLQQSSFKNTRRYTEKPRRGQNYAQPLIYATICSRRYGSSLKAALDHIFKIFRNVVVDEFHLDRMRKCGFELKYAVSAVKTVNHMKIESYRIKNNQKYLIQNVAVTKSFVCESVHCPEGILVDQIQCTENFKCKNTQWMNPSKLLELNCKYVDLAKTRLSTLDIENFLEAWKNSTGPEFCNVREMEVQLIDDEHSINYSKLDAKPRDPAKRHEKYRKNNGILINLSEAMDIERADGTIGSILFQKKLKKVKTAYGSELLAGYPKNRRANRRIGSKVLLEAVNKRRPTSAGVARNSRRNGKTTLNKDNNRASTSLDQLGGTSGDVGDLGTLEEAPGWYRKNEGCQDLCEKRRRGSDVGGEGADVC